MCLKIITCLLSAGDSEKFRSLFGLTAPVPAAGMRGAAMRGDGLRLLGGLPLACRLGEWRARNDGLDVRLDRDE
jgi:hypothetical protein